jgi:hypothetical protein
MKRVDDHFVLAAAFKNLTSYLRRHLKKEPSDLPEDRKHGTPTASSEEGRHRLRQKIRLNAIGTLRQICGCGRGTDARRERQRNDLQGNFVAQLVKMTIAPFIGLLSKPGRVNIALPARYEEEPLEQGIDIGEGGNPEHPGYATDDLQEGVDGSCGGGKQRLLLYEKRLG